MSNPYELRQYQSDLLSKIHTSWRAGSRRIMVQSPTGSGKTVLMGHIAKKVSCRGKRVLILAHRQELIEQAADKVGTISGLPVGIVKAGYEPNYSHSIQVASVQSLVNRIDLLSKIDLIIVDEAHHSPATTYRRILAAYPEAYILGVTATPYRLNGTSFRELYDELVCGMSIAELIDCGFLSKYRMFADAKPMITKGAKIKHGDYAVADIARLNNARFLGTNLVESYRRYANGLRCLVFALNIQHSIEIVASYNAAGVTAIHLDGKTPQVDRAEALKQFALGRVRVISNCQLFDEGFDLPALEAVQLAVPTQSLSRYLQMVGRAMRPAEGKENAIIIDHTDNWQIHGLPDAERIWTLDGVRDRDETKELIRDEQDGLIRELNTQEIAELIQIQLREIERKASDRKLEEENQQQQLARNKEIEAHRQLEQRKELKRREQREQLKITRRQIEHQQPTHYKQSEQRELTERQKELEEQIKRERSDRQQFNRLVPPELLQRLNTITGISSRRESLSQNQSINLNRTLKIGDRVCVKGTEIIGEVNGWTRNRDKCWLKFNDGSISEEYYSSYEITLLEQKINNENYVVPTMGQLRETYIYNQKQGKPNDAQLLEAGHRLNKLCPDEIKHKGKAPDDYSNNSVSIPKQLLSIKSENSDN